MALEDFQINIFLDIQTWPKRVSCDMVLLHRPKDAVLLLQIILIQCQVVWNFVVIYTLFTIAAPCGFSIFENIELLVRRSSVAISVFARLLRLSRHLVDTVLHDVATDPNT